jgi:SPP1 gp7 family putative phage head morphogenesis protein
MASRSDHPDLAKVLVHNTPLYAQNSLGMKRADMPQVLLDSHESFLASLGAKVEHLQISPFVLKPSQGEISGSRAGSYLLHATPTGFTEPTTKPLMLSKDNRIIDGHHVWAAAVAYAFTHPGATVPAYRVDMSTRALLGAMKKWSLAHGIASKNLAGAHAQFMVLVDELLRMNDNHVPAGSPDGGQFASKDGGAGGDASPMIPASADAGFASDFGKQHPGQKAIGKTAGDLGWTTHMGVNIGGMEIVTKYDSPDVLAQRALNASQVPTNLLPGRAGIQADAAQSAWNEGNANRVDQNRQAWLVIGGPGSGKSTAVGNMIQSTYHTRLIDADVVKKYLLPSGADAAQNATVAAESGMIAEGPLRIRAMQNGDNILMPKIGKTIGDLHAIAQGLKGAGYTVHLAYVHVTVDEQVGRAMKRFYGPEHKFVDPAYIVGSVNGHPESTYNSLKSDKTFKHVYYIDNQKEGVKPVVQKIRAADNAAKPFGPAAPFKPYVDNGPLDPKTFASYMAALGKVAATTYLPNGVEIPPDGDKMAMVAGAKYARELKARSTSTKALRSADRDAAARAKLQRIAETTLGHQRVSAVAAAKAGEGKQAILDAATKDQGFKTVVPQIRALLAEQATAWAKAARESVHKKKRIRQWLRADATDTTDNPDTTDPSTGELDDGTVTAMKVAIAAALLGAIGAQAIDDLDSGLGLTDNVKEALSEVLAKATTTEPWMQDDAIAAAMEAWAAARTDAATAGLDETTLHMISDVIDQAQSEGWSVDDLAQALEDDYGMSVDRAQMIADTEMNYAENRGALQGWATSDAVLGKQWLAQDTACPICMDMDGEAVGLDEIFSGGSWCPPQHPNCQCIMAPVIDETQMTDAMAQGSGDVGSAVDATDLTDQATAFPTG